MNVARYVVGEKNFLECICAEANDLPTDKKYDSVFASGVFQYFDSLEYIEKILDKMISKTKNNVGVLRILGEETEKDYLEFRRKNNPNYDEKYKDTHHLFISKNFFKNYANKHNLDYKFDKFRIKDFWNEPFIFDCFLYKKAR